jgi:hypothetical protein
MKEGIQKVMAAVGPALVVSAIISATTAITTQQVHGRLLEDNIEATKQLSGAVTDLRLQLGIFSERYVTREELEKRLRDFRGDK